MKNGFTLIELMIVVIIIGILASMSLPYFLRQQWKAKVGVCKSNLKIMHHAGIQYMQESNTNLTSFNQIANEITNATIPACPASGSSNSYSIGTSDYNTGILRLACNSTAGPFAHGSFDGFIYSGNNIIWNGK